MRSAFPAGGPAPAALGAATRPRRPATLSDIVPRTAAPTSLLVTVLAAELVTAAAIIASSAGRPAPTPADLGTAAYLAALGIVATTIALRQTAARGPTTSPPGVDLSAVWTFPAALLLHPALAVALVAVLHKRQSSHTHGTGGGSLHRQLLDMAAAVLGCLAARAAYTAAGGHLATAPVPGVAATWPVVLAVLGYTSAHCGVLAATATQDTGALDTSALGTAARRLAGPAGRDENRLTVATSSLGGLTAAALTIHPLLVLAVLPAACCLHRAVLARHLEHAGQLDPKTGLLTAVAWHNQAQRAMLQLDAAHRPRAVLVIDLDYFKAVNDTHGHMAGDAVLVAVADALRAEIRDRDLVGRFGGDEFVVLLTGHDEHRDRHDTGGLLAVAERIRSRVAALQIEVPAPGGPATITGLSVSIGATPLPDGRPGLQTLFQLADTALYAAKHAGRDTVRVSPAPDRHAGIRACPAETRHEQPTSERNHRL